MTKEEVARDMYALCVEKRLFTRSMSGETNYAVNRRVAKGECYKTKHQRVFASDAEASEWFDSLFDKGVIMSNNTILEYFPDFNTPYDVNKACMTGKLLKFDMLNKAAIYIKDAE